MNYPPNFPQAEASPSKYDLGPDGHFYRTFNQCKKMSFAKAREICEATSGSVVLHIKSNSTQRFIDGLQFLVPTQWKEPSKSFWLGLVRRASITPFYGISLVKKKSRGIET